MEPKDRLSKLLDPGNTTLNGIDFVEIASYAQTTLRVHFLNAVALEGTLDDDSDDHRWRDDSHGNRGPDQCRRLVVRCRKPAAAHA